jgi:hypothetical protein
MSFTNSKTKTPQQAAETRSIERVFAREGREGYELPLYIRVAECDLYPWDALAISILKEVAYMRVWNAPTIDDESKTIKAHRRTPAGSPFTDYENWCWAGQETIAERCRTSRETVGRKIKKMVKDGVLEKRVWYEITATGQALLKKPTKGAYFVEHLEYRVIESKIVKRIEPRPKKGRKPGTKTYQKVNADAAPTLHPCNADVEKKDAEVTTSHVARRQPVTSRRDNESPHEVITGHIDEVTGCHSSTTLPRFEYTNVVDDLHLTPSACDEDPSLRSEDQKPQATPTPKSKPNGVGSSGLKAESKPADDLAAYLTDDEPEKKAGRKPTPITSSAPSGYCPRCGEANGKHVNQPGMVCPVLKAKAAAAPAFDVEEA